ncbi:MAG: hypothetical protein WCQ95_03660 [Bacteroidota bacterium]
MASIKYSALISEMRGKLNGSVFSRNHYAAYVRNKVTPTNPRTVRQQEIRSVFANLSSQWRSLTQEQRNAWNTAVAEFLRTNIFGDSYKPSGINLFIRLNMNLYNIQHNMINMPPKPAPVDLIKIVTIKIDAINDIFFVIIQTTIPIRHFPVVSVTRPLSPGINFVKSEFRMIKFSFSTVFGHPDQYEIGLGPQYKSKFGSLSNFIGQSLFVKILPIDLQTGLNGILLQEKAIIQ